MHVCKSVRTHKSVGESKGGTMSASMGESASGSASESMSGRVVGSVGEGVGWSVGASLEGTVGRSARIVLYCFPMLLVQDPSQLCDQLSLAYQINSADLLRPTMDQLCQTWT